MSAIDTSDYVLSLEFPPTAAAKDNLRQLTKQLSKVGFYAQDRPGVKNTLLIFVKADDQVLLKQLRSLALKDYLHGLKLEINDDDQIVNNLSENERLRAVYTLITYPVSEGGAGITPGSGSWEFVKTITPIYDYKENTRLMNKWFKKSLIDEDDILKIKEVAGDEVALYFGFVRFYFIWLTIPAVLGLLSNFFFARFSIVFTTLNSLWAITFINAWKKKELIYATSWGTKGCSKVEVRRAEFKGESEYYDFATATTIPYYPPEKRTIKKIQFIPVAIFGGLMLLSYQLICFFIEIFLNEIYQGPGKQILGLAPTVLIVGGTPLFTSFYSKFVSKAVDDENHESQKAYKSSITEKLYVHNFLSAYAPLFITIFLYLPYGHLVNSFLPQIQITSSRFNIPVVHEKYQISSERLIDQFRFFSLISLFVNFGMENIVPVGLRLFKEYTGKYTADVKDAAEEASYLKSVRKQVALPKFDVEAEYRELVINFGYLAIFGPIWSLAPLFSLISNYVEIKGDLEKLLLESQRPVTAHAETIDPWNTNLKITTWIGTFIGPVITTLFRQQASYINSSFYNPYVSAVHVPAWKTLSAALVFENFSIVLNVIVSSVFKSSRSKIEHESELKVLSLRRSYIEAAEKNMPISKRDVTIDPTTNAWKSFTPELVLKQVASKIPEKSESEKHPHAELASGVSINDSSNLHSRSSKSTESTVASKTVPKTALGVPQTQSEGASTQATSTISLKSGIQGNPATNYASLSLPGTVTARRIARDSTPSSQDSLSGATLPPDFPSKCSFEPVPKKLDAVNGDVTPQVGRPPQTGYTGVAGADAFGPQPIEALQNSEVSKKNEGSTSTLDPWSNTTPAPAPAPVPAPAPPAVIVEKDQPSEHLQDAEGSQENRAIPLTPNTKVHSSESSSSTPSRHKSGLLKSIRKKAKTATHSLHLPTSQSK